MDAYEFVDLDEEDAILGFEDLAEEPEANQQQNRKSPDRQRPKSKKEEEALRLAAQADDANFSWGPEARDSCARQLYELDYAAERAQLPCMEKRQHDAHRRTTEPAYPRDFRDTIADLERWLMHMRAVSQGGWPVANLTDGIRNPTALPLLPKPVSSPDLSTVARRAAALKGIKGANTERSSSYSDATTPSPEKKGKQKKKKRRPPSRQLSLNELELKEKAMGNAGLFERLAKDKTLVKQPWYHGDISRAEALWRLQQTNPGTFLLRLSSRRKGITLSLMSKDGPKHFIIIPANGIFSIFGRDGKFKTIPKLVDFYRKRELATDGTSLVFPCPLPQKDDDNSHAYVEFVRSERNEKVIKAVQARGRKREEEIKKEQQKKKEGRDRSTDSRGSRGNGGEGDLRKQATERHAAHVAQLSKNWDTSADNMSSRENLLLTDDDDDNASDSDFKGFDSVRLSRSADSAAWHGSMFSGGMQPPASQLAASLLSLTPAERINPDSSQEDIKGQIEELTDQVAAEEQRLRTLGADVSAPSPAPRSASASTAAVSKKASSEVSQALMNLEALRRTLRQYEDHMQELRKAHAKQGTAE